VNQHNNYINYYVLQTHKSSSSLSSIQPAQTTIEKDMWRQMKRVGIPVFSGEKNKYETFIACIDKAPATPDYKLLQLRTLKEMHCRL